MACYKNIWRDFTYPQHPKFTYPGQDRLFPVTRLTTLDLHSAGVELINSLLYGADQNGKLFIHLTRIRIRPPLLTKNKKQCKKHWHAATHQCFHNSLHFLFFCPCLWVATFFSTIFKVFRRKPCMLLQSGIIRWAWLHCGLLTLPSNLSPEQPELSPYH